MSVVAFPGLPARGSWWRSLNGTVAQVLDATSDRVVFRAGPRGPLSMPLASFRVLFRVLEGPAPATSDDQPPDGAA
ncbi:MAG: hypothetical protein EBR82_77830 [Caulobacteraceae bacterium]|nr:hypothetical protein [Caulobacteraceae bacterium]